MALAHFRISINELFNKDPVLVPEESPLIILDSKFNLCMDNIVKETKHTRHISRGVPFVRNGENCNMKKIEWYEVGLKWTDIATKNFSEMYYGNT